MTIISDASLWEINMGDGSWTVCCLVCQRTLFRGAKARADQVFDTHLCPPIQPPAGTPAMTNPRRSP